MKCPNDGLDLSLNENGMNACDLCGFTMPENTKVIDTLYAWVSVDPNGLEGLLAVDVGNGVKVTTVASDLRIIEQFRPQMVKAIESMQAGYRLRLIKLAGREVLDELDKVH